MQSTRQCFGLAILVFLLVSCGSETDAGNDIAATEDTTRMEDSGSPLPTKTIGQRCTSPDECLGGLCVLTQYAPFRFCTQDCGNSLPGQLCPKELGQSEWTGLCVSYPDDFLGTPKTFCAPLCSQFNDCTVLNADWESCEAASWQETPLYPSITETVCMAKSAHSKPPLDPDTCEGWEELFDPEDTRLSDCQNYCEYLVACNHIPEPEVPPCCPYWCAENAIGPLSENTAFWQEIYCHANAYSKFTGSAMECTNPADNCGTDPQTP